MNEEYVKAEIKKRKIIYYLVSDNDIETLKSKHFWGDIYMILTSLCLTIFLSMLLSNYLDDNSTEDINRLYNFIVVFSGILTLLFLVFTIIFNVSSKNAINKIKTHEPERLEVSKFEKQPNPNYVGTQKIAMNIELESKEHFLSLFNNEQRFKLLETSMHDNTREIRHFTFVINNGNEKIYNDLKEFLDINKIKFKDYK